MHPGGCVGYRIEWGGRAVALVYDTEHEPGILDPALLDFIAGADLMIYDCTYLESEMPTFRATDTRPGCMDQSSPKPPASRAFAMFHHESVAHRRRTPPWNRKSRLSSRVPLPRATVRSSIYKICDPAPAAGSVRGGDCRKVWIGIPYALVVNRWCVRIPPSRRASRFHPAGDRCREESRYEDGSRGCRASPSHPHGRL